MWMRLALTWQIEIRHGQCSYCCEWFVVTFVSVVFFSLLSLTRSLKIHFKLILKAKSETNCIVTGEKCQWRNAVGAVELIYSDKRQKATPTSAHGSWPLHIWPSCSVVHSFLGQWVLQLLSDHQNIFLLFYISRWQTSILPFLFFSFSFSTEAVCVLIFVWKLKLDPSMCRNWADNTASCPGSAAISRSVHPDRETRPYKYLTTGNEKEG